MRLSVTRWTFHLVSWKSINTDVGHSNSYTVLWEILTKLDFEFKCQ